MSFHRVNAAPLLEIQVVSIPGMAMLKIIAWADGYPERSKDAIDFRFILDNYGAGQLDRLFSEEENLLEVVTTAYELAVAQLLGRDAGRIMTADTRRIVLEILEPEWRDDGQLRLVGDMLSGSDRDADVILAQIQRFRQGIIDVATSSYGA